MATTITAIARSFVEGIEQGNLFFTANIKGGGTLSFSCFNANLLNPPAGDVRNFQGPGQIYGGEFDGQSVTAMFTATKKAADALTGLEWDLTSLTATGSEDGQFFTADSVCTQEPVYPPNPLVGTKIALTLTQAEAVGTAAGRKELRAAGGLT